MKDRETKTLAEATPEELLEEIVSRSSSHAIAARFHSDKGMWRYSVGGDALSAYGLVGELSAAARKYLETRMDVAQDKDAGEGLVD